MNPEVSVVIPAYNTASYIAQAIQSALDQTMKNLEVIVVDDASTDTTLDVVRGFSDERVKVFVNSQNMGAGATRNRALKEARGKWIAVLDSDDWYAPERLERLLEVAYAKSADMIADDLYLIRDGEPDPWSSLIAESGETVNQVKRIDPVFFVETDVYGQAGLHLGISKPLFRRDFLIQQQIEYDASIKVTQDFWLTLTCLVRGADFYLVPEPYYFYRSRIGSLVYSNQVPRILQDCEAIETFLRLEKNVAANDRLIRALSQNLAILQENLVYRRVVEHLKQKQWILALKQMLQNSDFFLLLLKRVPEILNRRIQYHFMGNTSIYDIFPRSRGRKDVTRQV